MKRKENFQTSGVGKFEDVFKKLEGIVDPSDTDNSFESLDNDEENEFASPIFPYGGEKRDFLSWK